MCVVRLKMGKMRGGVMMMGNKIMKYKMIDLFSVVGKLKWIQLL